MLMEKNFKNMCAITRVAISFRAGYHHIKLSEVDQKYIIQKTSSLKIRYRTWKSVYIKAWATLREYRPQYSSWQYIIYIDRWDVCVQNILVKKVDTKKTFEWQLISLLDWLAWYLLLPLLSCLHQLINTVRCCCCELK